MISTTTHKQQRLARANSLEIGLSSALMSLGYWAVRPRAEAPSPAPLWRVPRSSEITRAPDLIVLGVGLIELKESLISDGGRVRLYTHQVRDYLRNWPSLPLPCSLWICASSGDYRGEVGVIDIRELVDCDLSSESFSLSLMDLYRVGEYIDARFLLNADRVRRVLDPARAPRQCGRCDDE